MLRTELLEIIRNGESSGIEFKLDVIEDRALAKELVAFANFQGGIVLLGIDDEGKVQGLKRPELNKKLEQWVMETCRTKIRPEVNPYFEIIKDVEPGKDVAVVRVDRGWSVHHVWNKDHRTYYIRVGTTSREASQEELERLFQQRGAFRTELRPVSGSSLQDLDRRRLTDYFARVRQQDVPGTEDAWRTLLLNTELLSDEGVTTPCTVAALLLFGLNPNRFLSHAGIDAVAYPGKEKDYASIERISLRGPMVPSFRKGRGRTVLLENGLVEQAIEFVRRNTGSTASLERGTRRVERRAYPEEAIRETIVNALVHRDYLLSSTDIELSIYEDRIEVISPGKLPNGITPERMRVGCRAARNQLLKDTMRDYGYLEHMGLGVPRKIIRSMREHNSTDPELIENGESFLVRLWKEQHTP